MSWYFSCSFMLGSSQEQKQIRKFKPRLSRRLFPTVPVGADELSLSSMFLIFLGGLSFSSKPCQYIIYSNM